MGGIMLFTRSFAINTLLVAIAAGALALSLQSIDAHAQELEHNIDRPGQDYRSFDLPAADPLLCQSACADESHCLAFTYVNPGVQGEGARCWLTYGVPEQVQSSGCVSGVSARETPAISAEGDSPPPAENADELWSLNASEHRGENGRRFSFSCPAIGAAPAASVWGTGTYTDDSSVCVAAVHAGIIAPATGGDVTIEMGGGQSSYTSTTQNGVTTSGYGSWDSSFTFVEAGGSDGDIGAGGGADEPAPQRPFPPAGESASATAQSCQGGAGTECSYGCAPGFPLGGSVWGTGIYTDDSSVCNAAVHAGAISHSEGGWVTVVIADGQEAYRGSTANGVTSQDYPSWGRSYTFAGAPAQSASGEDAEEQFLLAIERFLIEITPSAIEDAAVLRQHAECVNGALGSLSDERKQEIIAAEAERLRQLFSQIVTREIDEAVQACFGNLGAAESPDLDAQFAAAVQEMIMQAPATSRFDVETRRTLANCLVAAAANLAPASKQEVAEAELAAREQVLGMALVADATIEAAADVCFEPLR